MISLNSAYRNTTSDSRSPGVVRRNSDDACSTRRINRTSMTGEIWRLKENWRKTYCWTRRMRSIRSRLKKVWNPPAVESKYSYINDATKMKFREEMFRKRRFELEFWWGNLMVRRWLNHKLRKARRWLHDPAPADTEDSGVQGWRGHHGEASDGRGGWGTWQHRDIGALGFGTPMKWWIKPTRSRSTESTRIMNSSRRHG